jgi:signal peptide peptidase SppA
MPETLSISIPTPTGAGVKCAAQHFGAWAIEPKFFREALNGIRGGLIKPQPSADWDDDEDDDGGGDDPGYKIQDGIAIICIDGQMTKRGSSFGGCSTVAVRRAVRGAAGDWMVRAILLHVCSPGGTVSGTADLAEDVRKAREAKPVYAYIADLGASAAYWVASQCQSIWCNVTAMVGCIGTYTVLEDDTGYQEQWGVKLRVVSSGEYKGLGADGAVNDKLVADVQREIDELNAPFLADVSAGRGGKIQDIKTVADGRCHVGEQAQQLGLIDAVSSLDDALAAISKEIGTMPITSEQFSAHAAANPNAAEVQALVQQGYDKAKADLKPKVATVQELKAAFPGQGDFVLAQLEAGATLADANAAAAKTIGEQLTSIKTENAELKTKLAAAAAGQAPIPADGSTTPAGQMSDARRQELLGATPLGQAVLEKK